MVSVTQFIRKTGSRSKEEPNSTVCKRRFVLEISNPIGFHFDNFVIIETALKALSYSAHCTTLHVFLQSNLFLMITRVLANEFSSYSLQGISLIELLQ
jgi:hypothetical protein